MRLLFIYLFFPKGFSFPEPRRGGWDAGQPLSPAAPRSPGRGSRGSAAAPRFNCLLCQAGSLGRLPGGMGMGTDLRAVLPRGAIKAVSPRVAAPVPFKVALPPPQLPQGLGTLGFLLGIVALGAPLGARSEEKLHGDPHSRLLVTLPLSACPRPPHKGQGDTAVAVRLSHLFKHPGAARTCPCVSPPCRSCCGISPLSVPLPPARAGAALGLGMVLGSFSPRCRAPAVTRGARSRWQPWAGLALSSLRLLAPCWAAAPRNPLAPALLSGEKTGGCGASPSSISHFSPVPNPPFCSWCGALGWGWEGWKFLGLKRCPSLSGDNDPAPPPPSCQTFQKWIKTGRKEQLLWPPRGQGAVPWGDPGGLSLSPCGVTPGWGAGAEILPRHQTAQIKQQRRCPQTGEPQNHVATVMSPKWKSPKTSHGRGGAPKRGSPKTWHGRGDAPSVPFLLSVPPNPSGAAFAPTRLVLPLHGVVPHQEPPSPLPSPPLPSPHLPPPERPGNWEKAKMKQVLPFPPG